MIEKEKYEALSIEDKVDILWYYGEFVESITEGKFDVSLYAIDDFYVEVFYSVNSNSLADIRIIENDGQLERYTAGIEANEEVETNEEVQTNEE